MPKAPPPEPRKLTETELKRLNSQEEATMRELRLFLRDCLNKLGRDRKFGLFAKPVDEEEVRAVQVELLGMGMYHIQQSQHG